MKINYVIIQMVCVEVWFKIISINDTRFVLRNHLINSLLGLIQLDNREIDLLLDLNILFLALHLSLLDRNHLIPYGILSRDIFFQLYDLFINFFLHYNFNEINLPSISDCIESNQVHSWFKSKTFLFTKEHKSLLLHVSTLWLELLSIFLLWL